jgi:hypothetical protein
VCRDRRRPGGPPATASKEGGDRAGAGILMNTHELHQDVGRT